VDNGMTFHHRHNSLAAVAGSNPKDMVTCGAFKLRTQSSKATSGNQLRHRQWQEQKRALISLLCLLLQR